MQAGGAGRMHASELGSAGLCWAVGLRPNRPRYSQPYTRARRGTIDGAYAPGDRSKSGPMPRAGRGGLYSAEVLADAAAALLRRAPDALPCARLAVTVGDFTPAALSVEQGSIARFFPAAAPGRGGAGGAGSACGSASAGACDGDGGGGGGRGARRAMHLASRAELHTSTVCAQRWQLRLALLNT